MLKIAANISMLFPEIPLLERFQAARAAGFDGVEMQFPHTESARVLARNYNHRIGHEIFFDCRPIAGTARR